MRTTLAATMLSLALAGILAGGPPFAHAEVPDAVKKKSEENKKRAGEPDKFWRADQIEQLVRRANHPATVRGTVVKVHVPEAGNLVTLDFGRDHRTCFKAVILASSFEKWEGGIDGIRKRYEGKPVVVQGQVTLAGKGEVKVPQIIVEVPEQIRLAK